MLNPIHTILGYSQWIVTRVVELESALVHTTAENRGSKSSFDCVCLIIMYKTSERFIISICYLVPIGAMLKVKVTKSSKATIKMKEAVQWYSTGVFASGCFLCTNRANQQ